MDDLLIQQLQVVLADSVAMLALAERAEWDELVTRELARQQKIAALRQAHPDQSLVPASEPWKSQAVDAIQRILDCDDKTRHLAQQWMTTLATDLGELQRARKVGQAYLGG